MAHSNEKYLDNKKHSWLPDRWASNIAILILVLPVAYKIAVTPFNLNIDLNALISLLLALFSVGLSAMFFFKANETSNSFYDNTYKFTKDIAELLVRIESGFGERLKHIDEGYTSMRDYIQTYNTNPKSKVEETKQKIQSEEQEIVKVVEERNKIIQELVEKSQLQEEEKLRFTAELKAKEEELSAVQNDLLKLRNRLTVEKATRRIRRFENDDFESGFADFTYENVVRAMGGTDIVLLNSMGIKRRFYKIKSELPSPYIQDLKLNGYYDDDEGLTDYGIEYLRKLVKYKEKANLHSARI